MRLDIFCFCLQFSFFFGWLPEGDAQGCGQLWFLAQWYLAVPSGAGSILNIENGFGRQSRVCALPLPILPPFFMIKIVLSLALIYLANYIIWCFLFALGAYLAMLRTSSSVLRSLMVQLGINWAWLCARQIPYPSAILQPLYNFILFYLHSFLI